MTLFSRFSSRATSKDWYSPRSDVIYACSAMFSSFVYGIEPENLDSEELKTRIGYHSMVMSVLNPAHPFNLFPSLWLLPLPLKKKLLKCLAVSYPMCTWCVIHSPIFSRTKKTCKIRISIVTKYYFVHKFWQKKLLFKQNIHYFKTSKISVFLSESIPLYSEIPIIQSL